MYARIFPATIGVLILAASAQSAFAYLDPGTGSFLLQILIGGVAGTLTVIKFYWEKIRSLLVGPRVDRTATESREGLE